jgi:membrane protein implicated in regulation of membrane protease activity
MEKTAYALLLAVAALWLIAMLVGMIVAFPFGLIGLVVIVAVGLLLIKVLRERRANKEDDYYANNVDR